MADRKTVVSLDELDHCHWNISYSNSIHKETWNVWTAYSVK